MKLLRQRHLEVFYFGFPEMLSGIAGNLTHEYDIGLDRILV